MSMHARIEGRLFKTWHLPALLVLAAGLAAFGARFLFGLGATTNLSNTYPWGLWIVVDLVWIALAAGAFVTAGLAHLTGSDKYHPLARSAVLLGLLSYGCVVVTLLADLGLPWHAWQILVQRPKHSAMYEVSWCVGLYTSVLVLEFAPAVLELLGWRRLDAIWRKASAPYIVAALTVFNYLMSHSVVWAAASLVFFSALAIALRRPSSESSVPILVVIAGISFSAMHQSSLGSLFLLMPDKLSPLWWSPILPLCFFVSAVAAGLACVMLMELTTARAFGRRADDAALAGLGRIAVGTLVVYAALRLGDVAARRAFGAAGSTLFWAEIVFGCIVPAVLLANSRLRRQAGVLTLAAIFIAGGVAFNRLNVVLLGMNPTGPMPGTRPESYVPSVIEIVLSTSLVVAMFFAFSLAVRLLPVLPHDQARHGNR
jgi:formate dehydrogenase iron-sulfur subunit